MEGGNDVLFKNSKDSGTDILIKRALVALPLP